MIVVFGSINVDLIVPVERLPRPGETVLGGDYLMTPGGKGANQAMAARRAGAAVALAGAVGDDAFAGVALDGLRHAGVDLRLVRRVEQPTGYAGIMVAKDGENMIAVASGANAQVRAEQVPEAMLRPDTLLVAQMEVSIPETAAMIRRVRAAGGRILLNLAPASPLDPALLPQIDLLVANEGEAASLGEPPEELARRLRQGIVVTRGAAGSLAFLADGSRLCVSALEIAPIDTTGAGDAFVGALAAALDCAMELTMALRRASAAAGLACLARGAQTVLPDADAIAAAVLRLPS
jgi:ribokinase